MPRHLPPLKALRAFEAAARYASFTRAAEELHVTPTAISQQVKLIEEWLGFSLFHRLHNALMLTEKGEAFLPSVSGALDNISEAVEYVRGFDSASILTICARPNFGTRWLMPRLPKFQAEHPGIEIRLYIAARFPDLDDMNCDVAIISSDERSIIMGDYLFSPELLPVCSPGFLERHPLRTPEDLRDATLIHMINSMEDWRLWLNAAGLRDISPDAGPKFDTYILTLDAAIMGWGLAMARDAFVEYEIADGRLVAPFDLRIPPTKSWYLMIKKETRFEKIAAFRSWVLDEASDYRARVKARKAGRRREPALPYESA